MGIIHKLDREIIKRIAAGEVIERPSSIVKEAVENAIDAGASRIVVELSNGGLTSIKITDNGIGIAAEDVPLLMERHVTSKINDIDDLDNVGTLGFRGEALYSIASVTQLSLRTRAKKEDAGTELSFVDGRKEIKPIAHPVGTSIEANSLFYNTPARRKFLKSSSSEYARCAEVVTRFALAYPHIAFELIHDKRMNLQATGAGVQDVLLAVFGKDDARHFIPVTFRDQRVGIRGQISDPELTRTTRKDQTFTINGRVIFDIALNLALERAFARIIQPGKKPLCVLDISIDPTSVDVNVHPYKREVRLAAPRAVYDAIQISCTEALKRELGGLPAIEPDEESPASQTPVAEVPGDFIGDEVREKTRFISFKPKTKHPGTLEDILDEISSGRKAEPATQQQLPTEIPLQEACEDESASPTHTLPRMARDGEIIQYLDTYLIFNNGGVIYVADQHNLHETILYREMKDAGEKGAVSQKLLFPVTVEFTPEISALITGKKNFLKTLGYDFEDFGGGTFLVRALPNFLSTADPKQHLLQLFDEVGGLKGDEFEERFIVGAACQAAVKAGTRLSPEEMSGLAAHLFGKRGFNCPHGRPAVVVLDNEWFSRTFKRPLR